MADADNPASSVPPVAGDPAAAVPPTNGDPATAVPPTGSTVPPVNSNIPSNGDPAAFSFADVISEKQKSYLQSQGIDTFDDKGIAKMIELNQKLRAKKEEKQTAEDTLSNLINPQPDAPPTQSPVAPPTEPPVTPPTNPVNQGGNGMPSKLELLNFASVLKGQYPEIAEAIDTGAIYTNMVDMGISLVKDGQFNVDGVIGFAKMQNDQAALRKQLAEATKQPADAQPDATVTIDSTLPVVNSATMTEVQAQNIILLTMQQRREGKGDHPQFKEAETFIANAARKR